MPPRRSAPLPCQTGAVSRTFLRLWLGAARQPGVLWPRTGQESAGVPVREGDVQSQDKRPPSRDTRLWCADSSTSLMCHTSTFTCFTVIEFLYSGISTDTTTHSYKNQSNDSTKCSYESQSAAVDQDSTAVKIQKYCSQTCFRTYVV